MTSNFALDTDNRKMMGVCSGFARWTGVDATIVRVGTILIALCTGPIAAVAYVATGMSADRR